MLVVHPGGVEPRVAAQVPKTMVPEYTGVGHGQYRNSLCARTHIETYLTSLKLPSAGGSLHGAAAGQGFPGDRGQPDSSRSKMAFIAARGSGSVPASSGISST